MQGSTKPKTSADKRSIPIDAHKIKRLRKLRKLTMEEASKSAGFSHRQTWYQIERGRRVVSIASLERIARALGVSARDLLK